MKDPRLFQIGVLGSLLVAQIGWIDFGASPSQAGVTLAATMATQALAGRMQGRGFDWRSPAITGLSLSLLLRSHDPAIWVLSGIIGIGSKSLLRAGGRHVFNPACLAIVVLLLTGRAWVSPGQWGAMAWSALLLGGGGALVLSQARRIDTAVAFLLAYAGMLLARALLLGDPLAIPVHQMQSGALLIFALFMITDPRTTPSTRAGRVLFAVGVAGAAFALQFGWQVREGLFYALALAAPLSLPLDAVFKPARESVSCAWVASPSSPPSA